VVEIVIKLSQSGTNLLNLLASKSVFLAVD